MSFDYDLYNFIRTATEGQLADICLKMIALHPDTFESIAKEILPQFIIITEPLSKLTWNFTPAQIRKFKTLPDKIAKIKELRAITQFGLKEAKDMVESQAFITATT